MQSIKITRRQFLKWISASAAVLGLSQTDLLKINEALAAVPPGPVPDPLMPLGPTCLNINAGTLLRVIWIAGAACSGCPTSLLNYIADANDPDVLLRTIATNNLHDAENGGPLVDGANYPLVDIEGLYPVSGGADNNIDIAEVVLEIITIDYAQILMAASGDIPNQYLLDVLDSEVPYVLLVEGTIQTGANGKFCRIMDVPGQIPQGPWSAYMTEYQTGANTVVNGGNADAWRTDVTMLGGTLWLAGQPQCLAVIALGTCASFGGVPAAKGSVTGGKSAWEVINPVFPIYPNSHGPERQQALYLLNVPGCPPHPDWFLATAAAAILELSGLLPGALLPNNVDASPDHLGRPKLTYCSPGNTIYHKASTNYKFCTADCPRLPSKPGLVTIAGCQKKAGLPNGNCLMTMGCNGYRNDPAVVRADCPTRMWNPIETYPQGTLSLAKNNWCVGNNMPCQGCTDPGFPDKSSPFYVKKNQTLYPDI